MRMSALGGVMGWWEAVLQGTRIGHDDVKAVLQRLANYVLTITHSHARFTEIVEQFSWAKINFDGPMTMWIPE